MNALSYTIDDNVAISITSKEILSPTVSVTNAGQIGGIILDPKQPWTYFINNNEGKGREFEASPIRLTVNNYNGYPTSVLRLIKWQTLPENFGEGGYFYEEVTNGFLQGTRFWADGEDTSSFIIKSDLSWQKNIDWLTENTIRYLQGYEQSGGQPRIVKASFKADKKCCGELSEILDPPEIFPSDNIRWNNGVINFGIKPYNKNSGRLTEWFFHTYTEYISPTSRYPIKIPGCNSIPDTSEIPPQPICECIPSVKILDPLSITITDETEGYYLRDGISAGTIVATIKWKGEHIRGANPMPRVAFVAGTNAKPNLTNRCKYSENPECIDVIIDTRFNNFIGVDIHKDINLEPYFLDASYTRTDVDALSNHTHTCVVDDNGNGSTTSTIRIAYSTTPNHTHTITNYIAESYPSTESSSSSESENSESSEDILPHIHEVRCVAITTLKPTTNISVEIQIIGYVLYDPTKCDAHYRGTGTNVPEYLFPPESIIKTTYTYYIAQKINKWGNVSENNYFALYVAPTETYYSGTAISGGNYSGDPIPLNANASIGDTRIYLSTSTQGFNYGMSIKIMSNNASETNTVLSTSLTSGDSSGAYLILTTPLKNNYKIIDNAMVVVIPSIDILLTQNAEAGDNKVYITNINGLSVNTMVSLTSVRNAFPVLITEIGREDEKNYISFTPALLEDLNLEISPVRVMPGLNIQSSDPNVKFVPKTIINTSYLMNRVMANDITVLGLGNGSDPSRLKIEISVNSNISTARDEVESWEITGNNAMDLANVHAFSSKFFTAETPYITKEGFDIRLKGRYTSFNYYDTNTYPWTIVTVPEKPITDGSRVCLNITGYLPEIPPEKSSDPEIMIVEPGTIRNYAVLKCDLTFSDLVENISAKGSFKIYVDSTQQWIPGTFSLTNDFTNDQISLSNAVSQIDWLGASQIYDAVYLASNRMIQAQFDNNTYQDYVKTIFIITDGDENTSENSLAQAVKNTNFINGNMVVPINSIQLGLTSTSDEIVLIKLADETNGTLNNMINYSDSEITDLIDFIITNKDNVYNQGTYSDNVTFDTDSIPVSLSVNDYSVGPNQAMNYKTRQSLDGENWSSWTDPLNVLYPTSYEETPENITRYLGYDISLYGDEYFNSPILYNSPEIKYLNPETVFVSFMPIGLNINAKEYLSSLNINAKEYLSSILITHEADIANTSSVQYGVSQVVSSNLDDYYIDGKYIDADTHQIMLSRYNEPLITLNNKKYVALNGRWSSKCNVEVYRINSFIPNGQLVDPGLYAKNSEDGTIIFTTVQSKTDKFLICIYFESLFRIIQKTTNYGKTPATIHYIGAIYNTAKRIPTYSNGNIIHKDIGSLI